MRSCDQRALVDRVNDAAAAQERIEIDRADRGGVAAVVQRRIGMRAKVRRQRDRADVDRAARADLGRPSLLIGGVAGKRRRRRGERRRNVPESRHVSGHNSADEFTARIPDARHRHLWPGRRHHQHHDRRRHLPAAGLVAASLGAAAPIAYVVCAVAMGLIVICIADAGKRVTLTGGPYAYVGAAFGPYAGFLSGVLLWMLGTFATAAVSTVFASSIAQLVPALSGRLATTAILVVGVRVLVVDQPAWRHARRAAQHRSPPSRSCFR